jgi:Ca-activated chloride channel family protein
VKLSEPWWLIGTVLSVAVAGLFIFGGVLLVRAVRRFGDEERVEALVTTKAGGRRALKGILVVLTTMLAFLALAGPQYGRGTRLIPATNLDVVIVLDYSKSMYAQDVAPSRIARAKNEVGRLIADLPGARVGAVAFAGEPLAFPLTSDGAAIAQFFRQLTPNDLPVGGTAIARALEAARELLARDPLSKKHKRVIVLVTDGEDLEGDPVSVAQAAANEGTAINVVQIGGRTPEPIPEVDEGGEVVGMRTDEDGKPLTTQLSAEGEAQLAKIASVSGGYIVQSERGGTGIRRVAARMRKLMTEELSEKVETVYADVYAYPLGLAAFLLLLESFIGEAPRHRRRPPLPPPPPRRRFLRKQKRAAGLGLMLSLLLSGVACETVDRVFTRNAPEVDEAISYMDGGDASAAVNLLTKYLGTGPCESGSIGAPPSVKQKPNAGFDLGLALFEVAESFGKRFGEDDDESKDALSPEEEAALSARGAEVDCALRIALAVAADHSTAIDVRARAHYLAGNLEFLRKNYRGAVEHYDRSLGLIPGLPPDAGDAIGRDAAWNRAIALRRAEEEDQKRDAGQDQNPDSQPDASDAPDGDDGSSNPEASDGSDGNSDAGNDGSSQNQSPDAGSDGGSGQDSGTPDAGSSGQQPPPTSANQDERMLDMLERAPTLQQEAARNRALRQGPNRGMEDK